MQTTDVDPRRQTANRILFVAAVVIALIHVIDFVFYGQSPRNLAGALGFALIAYGTRRHLRSAVMAGAAIGLASIVAKYLG